MTETKAGEAELYALFDQHGIAYVHNTHPPLHTVEESRQLVHRRGELVALVGRRLRGLTGLDYEAGDVALIVGKLANDHVRVVDQLRDHFVLLRERRQHSVGLAQRRVRTLKRRS